jgi:hypothetical protein
MNNHRDKSIGIKTAEMGHLNKSSQAAFISKVWIKERGFK